MKTLFIAYGNPLRRDDGVASEVLRYLAQAENREWRVVHQLTPELADEAARFDRVVFLDADIHAARVTIEPVGLGWSRGASVPRSPLTHSATPAEIVAIASGMFGFAGEALLCRIPARDFSAGTSLSRDTAPFARQAAEELENLL